MIKGLYSAFTAMEAAWQYQDVLANNIANANTAGFKREIGAQQSFEDVLLSQRAPVPAPISARIEAVVGQIGTGSFMAEFVTDYSPGNLDATGQPLDFGLDDGFFGVQDENGEILHAGRAIRPGRERRPRDIARSVRAGERRKPHQPSRRRRNRGSRRHD